MKEIFNEFFEEKGMTVDTINFEILREWLTAATPAQLNNLAKIIIQKYFT